MATIEVQNFADGGAVVYVGADVLRNFSTFYNVLLICGVKDELMKEQIQFVRNLARIEPTLLYEITRVVREYLVQKDENCYGLLLTVAVILDTYDVKAYVFRGNNIKRANEIVCARIKDGLEIKAVFDGFESPLLATIYDNGDILHYLINLRLTARVVLSDLD